ncbi:MAG: hypothetical protein BWY69_00064 [Planctomycetes bacterium ADurb.Bin401]|nr:MAG: hypothetical protein BWY69_00064 [Planctomycetes bacterium ADurb.Bin401]
MFNFHLCFLLITANPIPAVNSNIAKKNKEYLYKEKLKIIMCLVINPINRKGAANPSKKSNTYNIFLFIEIIVNA